jgi:exodeoxyribonuclease VII large subunit
MPANRLSLWVTGEITNLRRQMSGHVYFTLKDAAAQLSCVLFRNDGGGQSRRCWPMAAR